MKVNGYTTPPVASTQKPTEMQRQESVQRQAAEVQRSADPQQQPKPAQPVVNPQGQTTGRLLNVTA
ncbi:MAG: hypothetical protein Fur007_09500 [Rhodoferax sp.]